MSAHCRPAAWWLGTLLSAAAQARAETLYVVEQLVVNVASAPDGSGERVATAKSGEAVEVIERAHDQIHVRLGGGRDGWVRASYLSSAQPLRLQLTQRDAQLGQLQDELHRLQAQLTATRAAGATPPAASAVATAADAAPPPVAPLFPPATEDGPRRPWPWVLGGALAGLMVGFALGALILDRHIRRKYGGLRIY